MDVLNSLYTEHLSLIQESRALLEREDFNDSEEFRTRHERIMADVQDIGRRIDQIEEARRLEDEVNDRRSAVSDLLGSSEQRTLEQQNAAYRAQIMDVIEGRSAKLSIPFVPEVILREQEIRAMVDSGKITRRELRTDILTGDASTVYSSYLVPTTLMDRLNYHANAQSGVLKTRAFQFYTKSGEAIDVPKLVTDASAGATAEGTASTVTNPVFGKTTFNAYRQDGHFIVSKEMLGDSIMNVELLLGNLAGRALATQIATQLASGDGSGDPAGINYTTELSTSGKTAASATTFTVDELIALMLSVLPKYRQVGEWVMSTTAFVILSTLKDGSNRYYWTPSGTPGEPDRLMGKPVYEDAGFQAVATGTAPVVFGDWETYWIRWARGGMEFARDDSMNFTSFESVFRFAVWMDADITDATGALKHLTML